MNNMTFDPRDFYTKLDELYAAGDLQAVESFILSAAKESRVENEGRTSRHIMHMNELAGFYRGQSRFEEAMAAFQETEEALLSLYGDYSSEYATFLNNKAGAHRMIGELEKSLALFQRSLEIYEVVGENNAYLLAGVLNNIAILYQVLEKKDMAIDALISAAEKLKENPQMKDELVTVLTNLVALFRDSGKEKEAQSYIEDVKRIQAQMRGEDADIERA
ncbi:MAG: tetratricopeptide repeat protein [Clostridiales Family XIII bacterium]|jgi:tetratricopeptide (TPR) repeat protein|nr:tetratricopeptide repeat protein [Clostridiales Family XIII bacterium]